MSALDSVAVCQGCWIERFGPDEPVPPPVADGPERSCAICGRETAAGLYLLRGARRQRRERSLRAVWREVRNIVGAADDDDLR